MDDEDRYTRITLRIPKELHRSLSDAADRTSKSLNAEIVARLEGSLAHGQDLLTELVVERARLETVRDSFKVVAEEAARQLSVMGGAYQVGSLAARAAMEDFDELAEITQELFDGEVRDMAAAQATYNRLLKARQVIEESLNKSEPPPMISLAEAVRERGRQMEGAVLAKQRGETVNPPPHPPSKRSQKALK